jgi:hypothetical protein
MEMLTGEVDWAAGALDVETDWPNTSMPENMMVARESPLKIELKCTADSNKAKSHSQYTGTARLQ